jgi:sporulation protein YlmC with PRC-barrel domain
MMKLFIASAAIALVLTGPAAWAAGGSDAPAAKAFGASTPGPSGPGAGNAIQKPSQAMIAVMPASQIVGRALKDAHDVNAGKIDSLVVDTKSGAVEFVMITPPESINVDNQLIVAPWTALDLPATATGPMTTKLSVDKLAKAPRIDPRLILEFNRPELRDRMYGFYGTNHPDYSGMGAGNRMADAGKDRQNELGARDRQIALLNQNGAKPPIGANKERSGASSALVFTENGVIAKLEALKTTSTAAMHDSDIYDSKGKDIGEFDQTMIDVNRGHVAYITVSHGGFLGMDENLYVIPIEALSLSPYRNSYRLTVDAQILDHEPALHVERGALPSRISSAQLTSLYQRFGVQPYWTRASHPYDKAAQPEN